MDNNTGGKRVMPSGGLSLGAKIAIIASCALLALVVGGYLGLCAYVNGSGRVLPHTFVEGSDLSGLTTSEAEAAVRAAAEQKYANQSVRLEYPGGSVDVSGALLETDAAAVAEAAVARGREGGFLGMGFAWLSAQLSNETLPMDPKLSDEGEQRVGEAAEAIGAALHSSLTETTYDLTEDALVLHKGTSGVGVNAEAVRQAVTQALLDGKDSARLDPEVTSPSEPDFESIHREVYTVAADAYLDKDTKEIVPSVTGLSFDISAARSALDAADEGSTCTVALDQDIPPMTTENLEANLFKDVLAQTKTRASSPAGRWTNIANAAGFVNGTILLPGETFSYNETCEPYATSNGYVPAGTYQNGKSVDATAGGICQLSSTLYWATLVANLETVERSKHQFNTGYLPIVGSDATVFAGSPDFKFKNSTDYPIKIETYIDKSHYVHVTIYGTNATGIYGDPYSIQLSYTPANTLYVAKAEIPVGTTQKDPEQYAYNGQKVEFHQRLRDKDGNVISDKVIHTDSYAVRDQVIWYNPADKAALGIDDQGRKTLTPVTPTPTPTPTPSAAPGTDPNPTPSPTPDPAATPVVDPTLPPETTPTPPTEQPTLPPETTPEVPTQTPPPGVVTDSTPAPSAEAPAA